MLTAAVIKVVLALLLGRLWGLAGIVLSNTISKLVTYAWYEPKVLFRDFFDARANSYLIGHIQNFIMLSICIAVAYFISPVTESSGWMDWILKGIIYTLCINAVYFLRFFKTPEFRIIINKVREILKK